jgi:glycosyltransferase involved in cell wall biosynthesis
VAIVHANNELYSHLSTVMASAWTRKPCVVHMRGIRKLTRMERWLAGRVSRFIVISAAAGRFYLQDGLPESLTDMIYDGIDLSRYGPDLEGQGVRREFGFSDEHVVIGIVSRLVPKKGQGEFLEALAILAREFGQVRGLIAGSDPEPDGAYRRALEEKARALGLNGRVVFAGWRDDVPQVNASFDIAVQATQYVEGLCVAVAEAMAAGKPVVASDIGGIPEMILPGKTGSLVRPGSSQALADAIRPLVGDALMRRRWGDAARERICAMLDQRSTVRQLERVFEQIAKEARS